MQKRQPGVLLAADHRMVGPASESHDLREGGRWTLAQRAKNDAIYTVAALGLRVLRILPRSWLAPIGRLLGACAHRMLFGARKTAEENVARVLPQLDEAQRQGMVRRVFVSLGEDLADTVALLRPSEPAARSLTLAKGASHVLAQALSEGRGVVYITAHLGPWERMAALLASADFPITTLARESYDPRFNLILYDRLRAARGVQTIYRGSRTAPIAIVRALSRGRVVGFPVDLPGRIPLCPVTFLGQPSHLPIGPSRIALRSGAPVVVGTPAPRHGGGLEVRIARVAVEDLTATDIGAVALTQRIADALGERIASLPLHWPWMHPSFAGVRDACVCRSGG